MIMDCKIDNNWKFEIEEIFIESQINIPIFEKICKILKFINTNNANNEDLFYEIDDHVDDSQFVDKNKLKFNDIIAQYKPFFEIRKFGFKLIQMLKMTRKNYKIILYRKKYYSNVRISDVLHFNLT